MYPDLPKRSEAVHLVQSLGVHGMSSDESDHTEGNGEAVYKVLFKPWRNPMLVTWLRSLDGLHLHKAYRGSDATAGMWPHVRVSSDLQDARPAIQGLPRNCYSDNWLQSRSSIEIQELNVQTPDQDLFN
jgi:hypothetical protein